MPPIPTTPPDPDALDFAFGDGDVASPPPVERTAGDDEADPTLGDVPRPTAPKERGT